MAAQVQSAGGDIPGDCELIEVRVSALSELFDAMDPSPFGAKDLDSKAEDFIVGWARDAPRGAPLALIVHLDRAAGPADEVQKLRQAIGEFFGLRAQSSRRRLRELLRTGRISLVIGLVFLAALTAVGDLVANALRGRGFGEVLRESLVIGGWVAMWRPLEVFLYGWWPIRREARLYDRLSAMPVQIAYSGDARTIPWHPSEAAIEEPRR